MTITFFGNSTICDREEVREKLKKALLPVMGEAKLFLCGEYGDFDAIAGAVLDELRREGYPFRKAVVTPYREESYLRNRKSSFSRYDEIIYPPLEGVPKRLAIVRRNEWMIDRSDKIFAYLKYRSGGSGRAVEYAMRRNKEVILI